MTDQVERVLCQGDGKRQLQWIEPRKVGRKARYIVVVAGNCQNTKRGPTSVKCQRRLLRGVMCLGLLHRARGVMRFPPM